MSIVTVIAFCGEASLIILLNMSILWGLIPDAIDDIKHQHKWDSPMYMSTFIEILCIAASLAWIGFQIWKIIKVTRTLL